MIKDLPEGQTHSQNDNCGESTHNNIQANFLMVGESHCFGCHQTFPPHEGALDSHDCGKTPTPYGCAECKDSKKIIEPHEGRSRYWSRLVDLVDKNFPKNKCKERGAALVMLAEIELLLKE